MSAEAGRFRCVLTAADEPACESYARVTITDREGASARGCPRHAMLALEGIVGARVDWADTKSLNEFEVKALEITEEIASNRRVPAADMEAGQ